MSAKIQYLVDRCVVEINCEFIRNNYEDEELEVYYELDCLEGLDPASRSTFCIELIDALQSYGYPKKCLHIKTLRHIDRYSSTKKVLIINVIC